MNPTLATTLLVSLYIVTALAKSDASCGWRHEETNGNSPPSRDSAMFVERQGDLYFGFGYTEVVDFADNSAADQKFFNDLWHFSTCDNTWHNITPTTGPVPPARAIGCWVYDDISDAIYAGFGVQYPPDFSVFNFWQDFWKYSFATGQWTNVTTTGTPYGTGGLSCASKGNYIYRFGGSGLDTATFKRSPTNDLWKYYIPTGTWSLVQPTVWPTCPGDYTTCSIPHPRQQHCLVSLDDSTTLILLMGTGFTNPTLPGDQQTIPMTDVWKYYIPTGTWTQLNSIPTAPFPIKEFVACAALPGSTMNNGFIYIIGGDQQGNKTTADTCAVPAACLFPVTPTSDTWVYDLKKQEWSEVDVNFLMPRNRKGNAVAVLDGSTNKLKKNSKIWLYGGTDFNGFDGEGSVRNRMLWSLDELDKY